MEIKGKMCCTATYMGDVTALFFPLSLMQVFVTNCILVVAVSLKQVPRIAFTYTKPRP
jgi:hypothetical protein